MEVSAESDSISHDEISIFAQKCHQIALRGSEAASSIFLSGEVFQSSTAGCLPVPLGW